jgi:hypothetical protein
MGRSVSIVHTCGGGDAARGVGSAAAAVAGVAAGVDPRANALT